MIKLLDKPLRAFTTYSMIVLLCSIPAYFIIIDLIWVHEINEHNQLVAEATKKNLVRLNSDQTQLLAAISLWNTLQPETKIQPVRALKNDSTYNVYRKDNYNADGGYDRFQGLVTYVEINRQPYSLIVEANVEESYETIIAITAITILFFIILLVGFIKLNKNISKRLWAPFYHTLQQIKAFNLSDDKVVQFAPNTIIEFQELNDSIARLMEGNLSTFKRQKEFTENASHELQTPLAIVQSKLDLLIQDDSITADQSRLIEETNNALSRVSRINKNLLLLAKIENQQFLAKQSINMSSKLSVMLELLANLIETRKIAFQVHAECQVEANSTLTEIMLTNLLMNAIRYTCNDAKLDISLFSDKLVVSNAGTYSLEEQKLFLRFGSTSVQTPGSGLGLSIVKEICDRHGWIVSYNFTERRHSFTITFNSA